MCSILKQLWSVGVCELAHFFFHFHYVEFEVQLLGETNCTCTLFSLQTSHQDVAYIGSLTDFDGLLKWSQQNCVPLVREITFDNAEVSIFIFVLF